MCINKGKIKSSKHTHTCFLLLKPFRHPPKHYHQIVRNSSFLLYEYKRLGIVVDAAMKETKPNRFTYVTKSSRKPSRLGSTRTTTTTAYARIKVLGRRTKVTKRKSCVCATSDEPWYLFAYIVLSSRVRRSVRHSKMLDKFENRIHLQNEKRVTSFFFFFHLTKCGAQELLNAQTLSSILRTDFFHARLSSSPPRPSLFHRRMNVLTNMPS